MYPASLIAYAFVKKGIEAGLYVTQMKLQKMVYFAHGYHLAKYGEPLINENFQAWQFGPVVPKLYHEYKYYGSKPIIDTDWLLMSPLNEPNLNQLDTHAKDAINYTWEVTKDLPATKLSNWSHKLGSPWYNNYVEGVQDVEIPNEEIKNYFTTLLA